jgi:hypothetical protein
MQVLRKQKRCYGENMWLITTFIAAIAVTAVWFVAPRKYQLGFLGIMLWGLAAMIFVDHIMGYEGGSFVEMETGGLIQNGVVLGLYRMGNIVIDIEDERRIR